MYLAKGKHDQVMDLAKGFLEDYAILACWAQAKKRSLFHTMHKHHTFLHLIQNAKFLNPRFHWCFKSEDFVGRMSRLGHSVSMGVRATRLCSKLALKYKLLLHLRFTRGYMAQHTDAFDDAAEEE